MPVPVTKYRCQFKCGMKAKGTEKDALRHEAGCYKNPANKTCVTCSNEIYERDGVYCGRGCKIELINDFLDELHDKMVVTGMYVQNVRPLYHCPNWNLAELQPETDQFLWDIRPKIELAAERRRLADGSKVDDLPF